MNGAATPGATAPADAQAMPAAASQEVFQKLGLITRQLHDTLNQLGLMPRLQQTAEGLFDARGRLNYIVRKTGEAADKVLTAVDVAKADQAEIVRLARQLAGTGTAGGDPVPRLAGQVEAAAGRTDALLTDIMLAQDFHDLTGQVVAKVIALAIDLEDSLVKLLVLAAPAEPASRPEAVPVPAPAAVLAGPVIEAAGRGDVVADQGEVDDLLASLGF